MRQPVVGYGQEVGRYHVEGVAVVPGGVAVVLRLLQHPPPLRIFQSSADHFYFQGLSHVLEKLFAGDLSLHEFPGQLFDADGLVAEVIDAIEELALVEGGKAHGHDRSFNSETETHCLYGAFETGVGRQLRVGLAHAWPGLDRGLASDVGLHSHEAPTGLDVIHAGPVHSCWIDVAVGGHPMLESLRVRRFEDGNLVHPDGFLFEYLDRAEAELVTHILAFI